MQVADEWFEHEDAQRFGQLVRAAGTDDAESSTLERQVLAAHAAGADGEVLRLIEANPGNALCFASLSGEMIAYIVAHLGGPGGALITLGCGRGLLEWLLARAAPAVAVRSFELAGVATDFFPEAAVTRVTADEPIPALPANAVLLCAWGETGMFSRYLAAHHGSAVVTVGEEMFTDPEPRCELEGWRIHASADFEGGNVVTVYWRAVPA